MRRGIIIGRALYCPVCQIFNHAAKHTHHIERALKTTPRLRLQLGQLIFIPDDQTDLITTAAILRVLRTHPAQNIRSLLNHLRFQHSHLYTTQRPDKDPDRDNPQSPLTHALHNVARTLNIPSCYHSLANPLPTDSLMIQRYSRAITMCPCPTTTIPTPGTPRMCEHCHLLRTVRTPTPSQSMPLHQCPACALPMDNTPPHTVCPGCIV